MALKLNSKQQAQLQFLEPFARQISSMGTLIDQMSMPKADVQLGRNLLRVCSSSKVNCMGLGLGRMADTLGQMEQCARRTGGGLQTFRTLKELHMALKQAYDVAFKSATTEHKKHAAEEGGEGGEGETAGGH